MRLFSIMFTMFVTASQKSIHHKMINISGKKSCVEAVVSSSTASRFGAHNGSCAEEGCHYYKGERYIPFCCSVTGFGC